MSYKINRYSDKKDFIVEFNHNQGLQILDGAELVDGVYTEFTYALQPYEIMQTEQIEVEVTDYNEEGEEIGIHTEIRVLHYPIVNPNYEAEQAQKNRERIAKLYLTGADVERGIYQAKGMDFDDILAFVMANPPMGLDVKALRIELKANHFYRGNSYVNAVGTLLGFTSEQLDKFFETNDYSYLISPVEEVEYEDTTNTTI